MIDQSVAGICFLIALAAVFNFSIHRIDEGHVGVYFRVSIRNLSINATLIFIVSVNKKNYY